MGQVQAFREFDAFWLQVFAENLGKSATLGGGNPFTALAKEFFGLWQREGPISFIGMLDSESRWKEMANRYVSFPQDASSVVTLLMEGLKKTKKECDLWGVFSNRLVDNGYTEDRVEAKKVALEFVKLVRQDRSLRGEFEKGLTGSLSVYVFGKVSGKYSWQKVDAIGKALDATVNWWRENQDGRKEPEGTGAAVPSKAVEAQGKKTPQHSAILGTDLAGPSHLAAAWRLGLEAAMRPFLSQGVSKFREEFVNFLMKEGKSLSDVMGMERGEIASLAGRFLDENRNYSAQKDTIATAVLRANASAASKSEAGTYNQAWKMGMMKILDENFGGDSYFLVKSEAPQRGQEILRELGNLKIGMDALLKMGSAELEKVAEKISNKMFGYYYGEMRKGIILAAMREGNSAENDRKQMEMMGFKKKNNGLSTSDIQTLNRKFDRNGGHRFRRN